MVNITNPNTCHILRDIIMTEMDLVDNRINIYNQKFDLPSDQYLFVTVGYKYSKIFSSRNYTFTDKKGNYQEAQDINTQEHLYVSLFSRGLEALQRKEEAIQALYSIYSQQQQEANNFRIFRIADIRDLSYLEGSAILYRFEIPVTIFRCYGKLISQDYYDTFPGQVDVNDGQPDLTENFDPTELPGT